MRYTISISLTLIFLCLSSQKTKPELKLSTDYLPTVEAFTDMKMIQTEYEKFKTKVKQNVSTDYQSCVNILKTLKCNNIDQWQSVIEELQLENKNSKDIELPFLESKKEEKTKKLKELIEKSEAQSNQIQQILEAMGEASKKFEINSQEIHEMYKLPIEQSEFIQQPRNVPFELNADGFLIKIQLLSKNLVPNIAQKQLKQAAKDYNIGDQSIQAQTTDKEMHEASISMEKTAKSLQASFEAKSKKILNEKKKLQEDIIRLRALISNEHDIQSKNLIKINELKAKINNCKGKPTSIEKDCLPIKLKGEKLDTELQIINARTLLLAQHIESMMKGFESEKDISAYQEKKEAENKLQKAKEKDKKFTEDQIVAPLSSFEPREKQPSMHFNNEEENI